MLRHHGLCDHGSVVAAAMKIILKRTTAIIRTAKAIMKPVWEFVNGIWNLVTRRPARYAIGDYSWFRFLKAFARPTIATPPDITRPAPAKTTTARPSLSAYHPYKGASHLDSIQTDTDFDRYMASLADIGTEMQEFQQIAIV
jgi:hypothetical protein